MITVKGRMCGSLALIAAIYLLNTSAFADESSAVMTVMAVPVERVQVAKTITATGNVAAWREIPISSEVGGLAVTEVFVDEGDIVEKGQVLARLNQDLAIAGLSKQKAGADELEASLSTARADNARAHSMSSGVMSAQLVEQRDTLVKTLEAKLAASRAQLDEAEIRFRQTVIVAPTAGKIATRSVNAGQVIQQGVEMFRLVQDNKVEINANVIEADLFSVIRGQAVKVIDSAQSTEAGRVRMVSPVVDPKSRLGTARIAVSNDTHLKPGMFVRVEISIDTALSFVVPLKALVWHGDTSYVFKVGSENSVSLNEVTIGREIGGNIEVLQGLYTGDRIVVQGAGLLSDGDVVNVKTASIKSGIGR